MSHGPGTYRMPEFSARQLRFKYDAENHAATRKVGSHSVKCAGQTYPLAMVKHIGMLEKVIVLND